MVHDLLCDDQQKQFEHALFRSPPRPTPFRPRCPSSASVPHLLDPLHRTVPLLKADEIAVQLGYLLPRHLVQRVLVDDTMFLFLSCMCVSVVEEI